MNDILTAAQAAGVIGCNPQKVRERMKRGIWKIGVVIPPDQSSGEKKTAYEISKYKLAKLLDIDVHEIDRRLSG